MIPRGGDLQRTDLRARLAERRLERRSPGARQLASAVAVETVAGALRGGLALPGAMAQAARAADGPFAVGLDRVVREIEAGAPPHSALAGWATGDPDPHVRVFVEACLLGQEMGAGLPDALERLGSSIRADADLAAELRVLSAPARASVALMLATPLGFGAVVVLPDPALREVLLGTRWGVTGLMAAAISVGIGAWWMRRLLRSVW